MDPPSPERANDVSRFLQEQLPGHRHPEKDQITRWKLLDNPVRTGFATAMVVEPSERIVSLCTVTPKRLWRGGIEQPCGEIGDTFTDAPYLRKGMFAACVNGSRMRAEQAGLGVIYGMPNDQSLPGYIKKLGFAVKSDLSFATHYALLSTRPLAARTKIASVSALRAVFSHPLVANGARAIAGSILSAVSSRQHGLKIDVERAFGADFDALWERTRSRLPIALIRDARQLSWRFGQSPFDFVVLGARRNGELVGYICTLTVRHGDEGPFVHTLLVDWLYDDVLAPGVGAALLSAALSQAVAERADLVSATVSTNSPIPLPFGRLGFIRCPREMPMIVYQNDDGNALLSERGGWHFTLSDTDAF